jgi:hypothetical protein
MQFLKSSVVLVLAFAMHASAAALPEPQDDCIPPDGICATIAGPVGICCVGKCNYDIPDLGIVSTYASIIMEWHLIPIATSAHHDSCS